MLLPNDGNPFAPFDATPAPEKTEDPVEAPQQDNTLPDDVNTIKEILAWVGDDTDKAVLVLESEESSETPRKSLITKLEEIVNG